MNKKFIAEIITIILAIIGGAVWIGNLQGQLSALNPESIKQEKNKAIEEIKALFSSTKINEKQVSHYNKNDLEKIISNSILKNKTVASLHDLTYKIETINDLAKQNESLIKKKDELFESKIIFLDKIVKNISTSLNNLSTSVADDKELILNINKDILDLKSKISVLNKTITELRGSNEEVISKLNLRIIALEKKYVSIDTEPIANKIKPKNIVTTMDNIEEKKNNILPMIQEYDGFIFSLQECKKSGSSIRCNFIITSKEQDRLLYIYGPRFDSSILFDNFNNKYGRAGGIQLANCSDDFQCIMTLLSDIPTHASITFAGIANNANSVALLKLNAGGEGVKISEGPIFRNIPLSN